jgi:hypothetical protein
MDRRINNETRTGIQLQVNENCKKINNHETAINNITSELGNLELNIQQVNQRAEKEEEEYQRRLWESNQRLECKIQQNQEKVTQEISKLEREVVALKSNLCDPAEIRTSGTSIAVPSTSQEPVSREPVLSTPEEIATVEGPKGVQGISSGEFPLPLFDENASVNPVAHLRHLEEFFVFRGIHKNDWLTVAKRSIGGSMSRQWLEATSSKFTNYEQFKQEFLATWWSAAQQGLTKCNLYQSKFDPSEGLSLSAHFLKHVTAASYLEPKLSDCETIEAIRCNYSPEIQKLLVTTKLNTIAEALEVLKRLEMLEERTTFRSNEFPRHKPNNNSHRNTPHFEEARRNSPVRQTQRGNSRNRGSWNHNPRYNRERDRRSMERERNTRRDQPPQDQRGRETVERERSPRTRPPETSREN